jgi:hypothetical protein
MIEDIERLRSQIQSQSLSAETKCPLNERSHIVNRLPTSGIARNDDAIDYRAIRGSPGISAIGSSGEAQPAKNFR